MGLTNYSSMFSSLQQHLEFDMPQAAYAHMDPILYKKLDWELTNGMDLLHHEAFQAADCEQVGYACRDGAWACTVDSRTISASLYSYMLDASGWCSTALSLRQHWLRSLSCCLLASCFHMLGCL